jgi:hypothetical protein
MLSVEPDDAQDRGIPHHESALALGRFGPRECGEGWMRSSRKDYARFVSVARGSLAEAEIFLLLSARTGLLPEAETVSALRIADKLGRQLNVLRSQLAKTNPDPKP